LGKERVASEEETLRRLVVELRILEGTAEALQSRVNLVNAALTELRVASMTMEGLEKEKKDAQLFVPIGGGSYIKARLESADKIIVGLGADVAVERTLKEAKENLGNRIAELEKMRTSLGQQLAQVVERIQEGRTRLEELTAKLREGESARGVRKAKERT
jgi:prefoldin alpha subunit